MQHGPLSQEMEKILLVQFILEGGVEDRLIIMEISRQNKKDLTQVLLYRHLLKIALCQCRYTHVSESYREHYWTIRHSIVR